MADLRLVIAAGKGELAAALKAKIHPIAVAATGAMREAANQAKAEGRAKIASAGFGPRWQNTLRVNVYPTKKVALDPAFYVHHKIPYAGIFEDGGVIHGRPTLWIPLPNTPKKIGRKRVTAAIYRKEIGPLRLVRRPGRRPLLVADVKLGKRTITSGRTVFPISTLQRQSRSSAKGVVTAIPMFIGIDAVHIRARFNIRKVCADVQARIPELFAARFVDAA